MEQRFELIVRGGRFRVSFCRTDSAGRTVPLVVKPILVVDVRNAVYFPKAKAVGIVRSDIELGLCPQVAGAETE